jgi:hypothetical protein
VDVKTKVPTIALVIVAITATIALMIAILLIGQAGANNGGISREAGQRASLYILLFGVPVMVALAGTFLYIGVEDWRHHRPLSILYKAQTSAKWFFMAYMLLAGATIIDRLMHGLRPRWGILYTPIALIFQSVLLFAVFASFAWVLVTVLRGRAAERTAGRSSLMARIAAIDLRARLAKRLAMRLKGRVDENARRLDEIERAGRTHGVDAEEDAG